jgi:hypothetical protein
MKYKAPMQPPFGWRVDPTRRQRLVVYEPEATIVRQIFQLASQGASPDKIAELFSAAGIPFPGERLDGDYMDRFLRHKHWRNPDIEPIVDPSLFDEVQDRLAEIESDTRGDEDRND